MNGTWVHGPRGMPYPVSQIPAAAGRKRSDIAGILEWLIRPLTTLVPLELAGSDTFESCEVRREKKMGNRWRPCRSSVGFLLRFAEHTPQTS